MGGGATKNVQPNLRRQQKSPHQSQNWDHSQCSIRSNTIKQLKILKTLHIQCITLPLIPRHFNRCLGISVLYIGLTFLFCSMLKVLSKISVQQACSVCEQFVHVTYQMHISNPESSCAHLTLAQMHRECSHPKQLGKFRGQNSKKHCVHGMLKIRENPWFFQLNNLVLIIINQHLGSLDQEAFSCTAALLIGSAIYSCTDYLTQHKLFGKETALINVYIAPEKCRLFIIMPSVSFVIEIQNTVQDSQEIHTLT